MMKKNRLMFWVPVICLAMFLSMGSIGCRETKQEAKDAQAVDLQQSQYAKGQPIPFFDWSLERDLVVKLYQIRNKKVTTHAVWRSNYGMIEGDCPCMGFGIPYDTSLTNPWRATDTDEQGYHNNSLAAIGQPEPNGIFASTQTAATWVMCLGEGGTIEPHYVESKVTVYPYPVVVDYEKNRVQKAGKTTVTISIR